MNRQATLDALAREHDLLAVYLFGSRAEDGRRLLAGEPVLAEGGEGSDLDVGVAFRELPYPPDALAWLQVALEDVFDPLRVDLVPLQRVDALFQYRAIDGHRAAAPDGTAASRWELVVMRKAAELLPIQRRLEEAMFGVSTS